MKLKVCGIQQLETLRGIQDQQESIDYLGFVFAPSRRQITGEDMLRLLPQVPEQSQMVGVFVDPTWEELEQLLQVVPLDVVQLHGKESAAFCQRVKETFSVKVWKAWHVQTDEQSGQSILPSEDYGKVIDGLLLDTWDKTQAGGTGKTFAWERIPAYRDWRHKQEIDLFVAGGLHADNIQTLAEQYQPDGIDVSSGVETDGVKDLTKIEQLTERVKAVG